MKHIDEIQKELENKKTEIEERLKRINVHRTHEKGALDDDWQEQAVERQNDEVLDSLDGTTRTELQNINTALDKIKEGSYGICMLCKKPINEARLKAIPFANVCINCAK